MVNLTLVQGVLAVILTGASVEVASSRPLTAVAMAFFGGVIITVSSQFSIGVTAEQPTAKERDTQ
jgi:hypothetical protein